MPPASSDREMAARDRGGRSALRLWIIETGRPSLARYGAFPEMFRRWLGPVMPDADFSVCRLPDGARLPSLGEVDALLLTGSPHGVYDDLPWLGDLKALLRGARDARIPIGGICFGHQVMAEAFGGKVSKSGFGWNLGLISYEQSPDSPFREGGSVRLKALAYHQDQITRLPAGARVCLSGERSPYAGLVYDFPALSVQFHPEFEPAFLRESLTLNRGTRIPPDLADEALSRLTDDIDAGVVARTFADFFRRNARHGESRTGRPAAVRERARRGV